LSHGGLGWHDEVLHRLTLTENRHKQVNVSFEKTYDTIRIIIQDEGDGFDWELYQQLDPDRAFDSHGRGIAMANMLSFDKLEYKNGGNEVHAFIRLP